MVPPSVLASMFPTQQSQNKAPPKSAHCGKKGAKHPRKIGKKGSKDSQEPLTPQSVLMDILQQRGYNVTRIKSDDAEYDAVPSPLQLASFGTHLVRAVHTSDVELLTSLLKCGLSSNPCNQFRDSIVDLVCKRANESIFACLLENGCDLQTVDGFGRTPLHHCCWASTFSQSIAETIIQKDPVQLFIEDKHGQTPLEYVRADLYGEWIEFLERTADTYWPEGGETPKVKSPKEKRPDGLLPDPPNAISVTLAAMVSSGQVTPKQVEEMDENTKKTYNKKKQTHSYNIVSA